ncbi:MAG TPA: hypothetical protein VGO40_20310 [Longimicrobium sp.]|jgi:hypothetical protein|nr:hypothetical protein [Longimicrobium sp.]
MISPEERAQFARIKEGYRDWLERARRESDERRAAQRRPRSERQLASPDNAHREPMGGGGR